MNIYYFDELNNTGYRKEHNADVYHKRFVWLREHIKQPAVWYRNSGDPWHANPNWNEHFNKHFMTPRPETTLLITFTALMPKPAMHTVSRDDAVDRQALYEARIGKWHWGVIRNMPNLKDIYVMDLRAAKWLRSKLTCATVTKIEGFDCKDRRDMNGNGRDKMWYHSADCVKASSIIKGAAAGKYPEDVCKTVLAIARTGDRPALRQLPIWKQVTCRGDYRRRPDFRAR